MAKRHQPVDTDYLLSSKYYEDVRAEMPKASYLATSKDVDMAKQAEQTGLTAQECATLIIAIGASASVTNGMQALKWITDHEA